METELVENKKLMIRNPKRVAAESLDSLRINLTLKKHFSEKLKVLNLGHFVPPAESLFLEVISNPLEPLSDLTSDSFDCVIATGPFSEILNSEERHQLLKDLTRVLRPSGILIAEFLPRLGEVADFFDRASLAPHLFAEGSLRSALEKGLFRFTKATGNRDLCSISPKEACHFFLSTGLSEVEIISLRGLFSGREDLAVLAQNQSPALFSEMLEIVGHTAHLAAVIETCGPALFVGRKEISS